MHATASLVGVDAEPGGRLLAFAAQLHRQHVKHAVVGALVRAVLLLATPSIVVAWLLPAHRLTTLLSLTVALLCAAALAWHRARSARHPQLLLAGDGSDPQAPSMILVGDELATWLENRRSNLADVPMVRWLGRDVEARLPGLPPEEIARAGRAQLGRWRRLVPFVLLLLLAWLLTEWLSPPWPGVMGGRAPRDLPLSGSREGGGGVGAGGAGSSGERKPEPGDQQQAPKPDGRDGPVPQEPPGPEEQPPEGEAPAPLLELPDQQRFVVPEFIDDGPTRRARVHAAEIERGGAVPQPRQVGAGGRGDVPAPPPPTAETFERAAEAAQRARHVPDEERPMVRRYFELLREAAK